MLKEFIVNILGIILVITGILDAVKYHWEARKIAEVKTAKGHSRKFINAAVINDIVRVIYLIIHFDLYLLISSLVAIVFMLEMWWMIYIYYPYETYPRKKIVKRPNLFQYTINSLTPNKLRRHL